MSATRPFVPLLLGVALISAPPSRPAAAADAPRPEADAPSTGDTDDTKPAGTALFDGRTLKNWKSTDFGREGNVSVQDGLLVIGKGEPLTGVTWDGGELPRVNYELRLEAQRVTGSDFFCGLTFPVGESCCTLILGGWGGSLTGLSSINYLDASENETTNFHDFEDGKWYKVRIRVTDKKIEAWLDDESLADVEYADQKIGIRFEMEPCKPLGVATYNTTGALRDFRLIRLEPDARPAGE